MDPFSALAVLGSCASIINVVQQTSTAAKSNATNCRAVADFVSGMQPMVESMRLRVQGRESTLPVDLVPRLRQLESVLQQAAELVQDCATGGAPRGQHRRLLQHYSAQQRLGR